MEKIKSFFKSHKNKLLFVFLLALVLRLILVFSNWHPDVGNHIDWGKRFWEYSPSSFYSHNVWSFTWPNQPPGSMYLWAFVYKIYEGIFNLLWKLNLNFPLFPSNLMFWAELRLLPMLLKLPSSLFDLGIGWLIYRFIERQKNKELALKASCFWLFNPIVFYNSAVWGQTDAIISFFGLASILALIEKKPIKTMFLFAISLYFKVSLAIFAPLIILVLIKQRHSVKTIIASFLAPLSAVLVVSLPFSSGQNPLFWLYEIYSYKVLTAQLHVMTANALNLWGIIYTTNLVSDSLIIGRISMKVITMAFWLLVFYLPILFRLWKKPDVKRILFSCFLIGLTSFIVLTNMHERYLYPIFPYFVLLIYFFPKYKKWFFLASFLHLINLYNLWWYPRINGLEEFFLGSDKIFLRIVAFLITSLGIGFYVEYFKKIRQKKI